MRLSSIDLNLLVAFDAIYRTRHLSRAANRLALSQSALSHALSRLRTLFGDALFVRDARGMAPTPFAHRVASPIREALEVLERGLDSAGRFDPARLRRPFRLGLRDGFEILWLPPLIARLRDRAPGVDLTVFRVAPSRVTKALSDGEIDAVVDLAVPIGADVRLRHLFDDHLVVLARKGHPSVGRRIDLSTYLELSHLRVTDSAHRPGVEDVALAQLDRRRRIAVRCRSVVAAARVLGKSDLLFTAPTCYLPLMPRGQIRAQPLPFELPTIAVNLYWHALTDGDAAHRWLRDELAAVVCERTDAA